MTVQALKFFHKLKNFAPTHDKKHFDVVEQALEEVEQYRVLGTVEELKEAREKQVAKKPRTDDEDWLCCRNCGKTFSLFDSLHKRNKYCGNCGQKIDWSDKKDD